MQKKINGNTRLQNTPMLCVSHAIQRQKKSFKNKRVPFWFLGNTRHINKLARGYRQKVTKVTKTAKKVL